MNCIVAATYYRHVHVVEERLAILWKLYSLWQNLANSVNFAYNYTELKNKIDGYTANLFEVWLA